MDETKATRIKELVQVLNDAGRAYYQEAREIMPNREYDALYDELVSLEGETGIVLASSPTVNVGYEVLSELPKEAHPSRMLSLDKTKDRQALADWLGDKEGLLSWKLDGLTVVLTYEDGKLVKAVTRGNGEIGEVVTSNAKTFVNLPMSISYKGKLVLRGEAVIAYSDFEVINAQITDEASRYKNPRNLCSGSVRQLNTKVTAERRVRFYAFSLVTADGVDFGNSRANEMNWLDSQGFETVERFTVTKDTIADRISRFAEAIEAYDIPSDGLVLIYDDIAYGKSLGRTAKFPRDAIAFKWKDETCETVLREIEWSASRTGLINPVAVFDPVEIEGTTVSRASVHNVSIVRELGLGIGDTVSVYKANMIIPQIAENLTRSGGVEIPETCPVCGCRTSIHSENGVETLFCENPECPAKKIKGFALFVSRNAMDIEGLSEATLEKLINAHLISEPADIFGIGEHREEIVQMEGLGEKSFDNLLASVEKARKTSAARLLYSLGIPGIGVANAKVIAHACGDSWEKIISISREELMQIDGIGDIMADAYRSFFDDPTQARIAANVRREVVIEEKAGNAETENTAVSGKTFVITGSLEHYENRDALKEVIESLGGKVSGSVSKKTDFLINNDIMSNSTKNKTAKELGVPIITEEMFTAEFLK